MTVLRIHPDRTAEPMRELTGIYVRARTPEGAWVNADIVQLDFESLSTFLRSRGGANDWAEGVVRILLGWNHDGTPRLN